MFLLLPRFLQSTDFLLKLQSATLASHVLNLLVMIWQRLVTVQHNQRVKWYRIEFYHELVHHSFSLSTLMLSTIVIAPGLNHISHICRDYSVLIIIQAFPSWLGYHPIFIYLIHVNRNLYLPLSFSVVYPTYSTLYHIPLRFLHTPSILHLFLYPSIIPNFFISSEEITWIYFDFVIFSHNSHLHTWPGSLITYFLLK